MSVTQVLLNPPELMWLKERVSTGSHIRQARTSVELHRLKDIQRLRIPLFLVFLSPLLKKYLKKKKKTVKKAVQIRL